MPGKYTINRNSIILLLCIFAKLSHPPSLRAHHWSPLVSLVYFLKFLCSRFPFLFHDSFRGINTHLDISIFLENWIIFSLFLVISADRFSMPMFVNVDLELAVSINTCPPCLNISRNMALISIVTISYTLLLLTSLTYLI